MDPAPDPTLPPGPPRADAWIFPTGTRRRIGHVTGAVFVVGAVMWALSYVPGEPTASFWRPIVFPAFVAVFLPATVAIATVLPRDRNLDLRRPLRLPVRGWRLVAGLALFVITAFSGAATILGGGLGGDLYETDGHHYSNDHGRVIEMTEDRWRQANARSSRLFAGGVMYFAGLSALVLTQPPRPDRERDGRR